MAIPKAVRDEVVRRAEGRCEYCRLPTVADSAPPHVDHVRAKQHRGGDDATNLALTCDRCNLLKGPNLSAYDPLTDEIVNLFDPRRMVWTDHFAGVSGEVLGLTPVGRATVELLRMNEEQRLRLRAALSDAGEWP